MMSSASTPSMTKATRGFDASGVSSVVRAAVETLCGEADANERVGGPADASPESAVFAGERVVVLAGFGDPRARAVFRATNFDDRRIVGTVRDAPVEAVAAHVHQPAAVIEPVAQTIEHRGGVILRMRAGDDRSIVGERRGAVAMQDLVGDHVEGLADAMQPRDQVGVGDERPRHAFRLQVQHGAQPRRKVHAAAVAMMVVERTTHLGMRSQIGFVGKPRFARNVNAVRKAEVLIRVREVSGGGREKRNRRARRPGGGPTKNVT